MFKPPDPPSFPQVAINMTNEGMLLSIVLAPGTSINQMIPAEQMDAISQKWQETRRNVKKELEIIDLVQRSKNR